MLLKVTSQHQPSMAIFFKSFTISLTMLTIWLTCKGKKAFKAHDNFLRTGWFSSWKLQARIPVHTFAGSQRVHLPVTEKRELGCGKSQTGCKCSITTGGDKPAAERKGPVQGVKHMVKTVAQPLRPAPAGAARTHHNLATDRAACQHWTPRKKQNAQLLAVT